MVLELAKFEDSTGKETMSKFDWKFVALYGPTIKTPRPPLPFFLRRFSFMLRITQNGKIIDHIKNLDFTPTSPFPRWSNNLIGINEIRRRLDWLKLRTGCVRLLFIIFFLFCVSLFHVLKACLLNKSQIKTFYGRASPFSVGTAHRNTSLDIFMDKTTPCKVRNLFCDFLNIF